jgi:hypothetical protein
MKSLEAAAILEVAKFDGRGRRLAAAKERGKLLATYHASGLTQAGFAEREGINRFKLATWLRNARLAAAKSGAGATPRFLEVRVPPVAGFSLEVVLADGMVLRGHDGQQLAALVRGLR